MVINYQNSHVSPFEGRGFRALGPIKKGDIYLKVRNVLQILIFREPFWLVMFLNLAGSLCHMLVSGQSKGCLQGRCCFCHRSWQMSIPYVHCILVRNPSPPFTILIKSKSQFDNSQIVNTDATIITISKTKTNNWPLKNCILETIQLPFLRSFLTFQIDQKLSIFCVFSVWFGIFQQNNASTIKWTILGIVHAVPSFFPGEKKGSFTFFCRQMLFFNVHCWKECDIFFVDGK